MKDSEVRGLILRQLYELRHEQSYVHVPDKLTLPAEINPRVAGNVAAQLAEQHLITFKEHMGAHHTSGLAQINAYGVDVVEGARQSAIAITFDQSINIHGSSNVQIGKGNVQNATLDKVAVAIDEAGASQTEKAEAKSLWSLVTSNKLLMGALSKFLGFG
jgi:hypothetical protein